MYENFAVWVARHKLILLITPVSAFLIFWNLDNIWLWQDEATTALLGCNALKDGVPTAYYGENIILEGGEETNENGVWVWDTWISYYLAGLSISVLGKTTLGARFVFALCGMASVWLLYYVTQRITRDRRVAILAAFLLSLSPAFLLHSRQCRCYVVMILATIWVLYTYVNFEKGNKRSWIWLSLSLVLLFYTNIIGFSTLSVSIAVHYLIRGFTKKRLLRSIAPVAAVAVFILPWVLFSFPFMSKPRVLVWKNMADNFFNFSFGANNHIFPLVLLIVPAFAVFRSIRRKTRLDTTTSYVTILLLVLGLATIACLSLFGFMGYYFRYMLTLMPMACIGAALIVRMALNRSKVLGYSLLLVLGLTNLFNLLPVLVVQQVGRENLQRLAQKFTKPRFLPDVMARLDKAATPRFFIWDFIQENTHEYIGPEKTIIRFLKSHAKPDDVVRPSYGDLPIIYYTDLKVHSYYMFSRTGEGDWVIPRQISTTFSEEGWEEDSRFQESVKGYEKIVLDFPDINWENRPDPELHRFRTPGKDVAKPIVIYRKRKD